MLWSESIAYMLLNDLATKRRLHEAATIQQSLYIPFCERSPQINLGASVPRMTQWSTLWHTGTTYPWEHSILSVVWAYSASIRHLNYTTKTWWPGVFYLTISKTKSSHIHHAPYIPIDKSRGFTAQFGKRVNSPENRIKNREIVGGGSPCPPTELSQ